MLALAYSLVLLPALLAVWPLDPTPRRRGISARGAVDRLLAVAGDWSTRHPRRVVLGAAGIALLALPGVLKVRFSHDGIRWFPPDDPLRVALELVDREFGGASSMEVLVRTGRENGLHEPDALRRIERLMSYSETLEAAGRPIRKSVSLVNVVKETNRALHENRDEFYSLPGERQLIAQELLLFENSGTDDLEDVTDTRFETARVTIRTPWADAMLYPPFLAAVERGARDILSGMQFEVTGGAVLFTRVFQAVIYSMASSYVFTLAVITPLMVLLIGNLRRGLLAMIPNLLPVYLVLALMGFAGIPLDASTLLIGGVIVGLAVDDTIHFMHKFGRYLDERGDARFAVHETLATTGSALLFTSLVLALGFAVLLAGYMQNTFWFGLLALTATVIAFVADILLGPALMVLVTDRQRRTASAPALGAAGPG
jgi:predicted RND superfamily exporter protein